MTKYGYTVGALKRRDFRAILEVCDLPFTEHKGWLDSAFVISMTAVERRVFDRTLRETGFFE